MPTEIDVIRTSPPDSVEPMDTRVWNDDGTGQGQRQMGNVVGTLLASAARTTTTNGAALANPNHRGIALHLNITAFSGTSPTIQLRINAINPVTGSPFVIWLPAAQPAATGEFLYVLYPDTVAMTTTVAMNGILPRPFSVDVVIGGTTPSITFSLSYSLLL